MPKPNRVTRLIRIIGIRNELGISTNPKRCNALHQLLAEATKDLTKNDVEQIHDASLRAFLDSTNIIAQWDRIRTVDNQIIHKEEK